MIQIHDLVKDFGEMDALRGLNLHVQRGEFLTILGPNGAGKTTLLRILATLLVPTSGSIVIDGLRLESDGVEIRKRVGFVSHKPLVYGNLSAWENLRFFGRLHNVPHLEDRVTELLGLVGLYGRRDDLARTLSRGMQHRLSLARAIIHRPSLLLLDEPYTGLDQAAIRMLQGLLQDIRTDNHTVVMTTHNLGLGFDSCDRISILAGGRIAYISERASCTLSGVREAYEQQMGGWSEL